MKLTKFTLRSLTDPKNSLSFIKYMLAYDQFNRLNVLISEQFNRMCFEWWQNSKILNTIELEFHSVIQSFCPHVLIKGYCSLLNLW